MGIYDSIDNRLKNLRSKHDEVSKVSEIRAEMEEINEAIREQIYLIGQFHWRRYFDGEYAPGEDKEYFDAIDRYNEELDYLSNKVDDCKILGFVERESIDNATNARIEQRRQESELRKRERAENRERVRMEKEYLRTEKEEQRRLDRIERERIAAEKAAEKAEKRERDRIAAVEKAAEKERLALERAAEKERLAAEKAERKARAAAEKAEKARVDNDPDQDE